MMIINHDDYKVFVALETLANAKSIKFYKINIIKTEVRLLKYNDMINIQEFHLFFFDLMFNNYELLNLGP